MSRIQCRFIYEWPNGGWTLKDGNGKKRSLNGTWVRIEEFCEVYHTMVVKTSSALILVRPQAGKNRANRHSDHFKVICHITD